MSSFPVLKLEYSACVEALAEALRAEDEKSFFAAVDHIVQMREPGIVTEVRKLTGDLQKALERFSVESKLADWAEHEIPDARARLDHVISMTDEAAHRTLDLVEQSGILDCYHGLFRKRRHEFDLTVIEWFNSSAHQGDHPDGQATLLQRHTKQRAVFASSLIFQRLILGISQAIRQMNGRLFESCAAD